MNEFKELGGKTYTIKLYVAGPIEQAKQVIRRKSYPKGLCVTVEPTTYIYAGGEEAVYVVGLLAYPRYPESDESLYEKGVSLLTDLIEETYQWSGLIVTPEFTRHFSRRPE